MSLTISAGTITGANGETWYELEFLYNGEWYAYANERTDTAEDIKILLGRAIEVAWGGMATWRAVKKSIVMTKEVLS